MNVGCVVLACTLLVGASSGSKASQPLKPPCRPGFSQNFYTVIVSRDVLHGQSILKEVQHQQEGEAQKNQPGTLLDWFVESGAPPGKRKREKRFK
ncbi:hypothetical protein L3Q82_007727 [Scortum barcoo]|uniref:Uncharacterized protein n=1 Tax=Scortum barcoo TaxID=214431 RepID=A0ACB8WS36_9TELE|nr:hypothetical protein L3Q82_007727 [Scortum barcoo]